MAYLQFLPLRVFVKVVSLEKHIMLKFEHDKSYIYFLKHKSEAFVIFQEFKALVEKESRKCIKTLCTDNAREYTKTKISSYLSKHGIKHQRIVPDKWFQVCLNPSVVNLIEASILSKIMTLA
jgi:hypothetical protein